MEFLRNGDQVGPVQTAAGDDLPLPRTQILVVASTPVSAYGVGRQSGEDDRWKLQDAGTPTASPLLAGTYARRILERLLVDLA